MDGAMLGRRQRAIIGALALMALLLIGGVFSFAFHGAPQIPIAPVQDTDPTGRNAGTPGAGDRTAVDPSGRTSDGTRVSGTSAAAANAATNTPAPPRGTLVYERNGTVYLLVLGGQERQLVPSGHWPKLSPDGTRVVYVDRAGAMDTQLLSYDTRTRQVSSVTNQVRAPALPAWSPDGRRIAFRAEVNSVMELFVIDADGGNLQQITHATTITDAATQPAWSSDGTALLYKNQGDGIFYRIVVAGGMPERVRAAIGEQDFLTPSPDGKGLAFTQCADNVPECALYVMDATGRNERKIAPLPSAMAAQQLGSLVWAPDGQAILIASGGAFEQNIVSLRDGHATASVAYGAYPSWIAAEVRIP